MSTFNAADYLPAPRYGTPELQRAVDEAKARLVADGVATPLTTDVAPLLPEHLRESFWHDAVENRLAALEAETHLAWLVTDHDDEPERIGATKFVGPKCARCGRRTDDHLSHGVKIAERVGGHPLDYVRKPFGGAS